MDFTINDLVYHIIEDENNEVTLYKTEGLKRPVRNIPAEVEYDGKKYKVTRIEGCTNTIVITSSYEGVPISGPAAFQGDTTLSNLSLPETIVVIANGNSSGACYYGAFNGCSNLKEINFPDSLLGIGQYAFRKCTAIEQLYFGDDLETIQDGAFEDCSSLKTIDFGDKVQEICRKAFAGCSTLQNVSFPESLVNIEDRAFDGCKSMTEVNIPASVKEIGSAAFIDSGVKVVNIYSEDINIASDAFPSDAKINFLDANSFPKRKRKARAAKTIETPKPAPAPKKEEPKPAPATAPKKEKPKTTSAPTQKKEEPQSALSQQEAEAKPSMFQRLLQRFGGSHKEEEEKSIPATPEATDLKAEETIPNAQDVAEYTEPQEDYVIIKTKQAYIDERGSLYEAVRRYWHADLNRAKKYKYVVAAVQGVAKEVFEVEKWYTSEEKAPRIEFIGKPTTNPDMIALKGKRLPATYIKRGLASPFLYKQA